MSMTILAAAFTLAGSAPTQDDRDEVVQGITPREISSAWLAATGDAVLAPSISPPQYSMQIDRPGRGQGSILATDCRGTGIERRCLKLSFRYTIKAPRNAGARAANYYLRTTTFTSRELWSRNITITRNEDFSAGTTRGHIFHVIKLMADDMKSLEAAVAEHGATAEFDLVGPPAEADAY